MDNLRHVPNVLSLLRILLALSIPLVADGSAALFLTVLLCGLTDALDGFLARKWHCASKAGARLDSLGDLVFFLMLTAFVFFRHFDLIRSNLPLLAAVASVRVLSLAVCAVRNGKAYSIHTIGNKATGFLIFAGIEFFILTGIGESITVLLWIALASALEELAIMVTVKSPDPDTKSIFLGRKGGAA